MKIIEFHDDHVTLHLSGHELATICNGVSEVCHGLRVVDFEAKMGSKRSKVELTLDEISNCYDKMQEEGLTAALVRFSDRELRMIIGALKQVCQEIEDWEIPTRMGAEVDEIDEILVEIINAYQKMKKVGS